MSTSSTNSRSAFKFLIFLSHLIVFFAALLGSQVALAQWNLKGGTLSADTQGWAFRPTIAADSNNNNIYACWSQHTNPAQNVAGQSDYIGNYCKKWNGSTWTSLGGRIGQSEGVWQPSVAVLSGVPYLAWYEGLANGYGAGTLPDQIFVAHWNGSNAWVLDSDAGGSSAGGLNTDNRQDYRAHNPHLAVIGGVLYCAWDQVGTTIVKHLSNGTWTQDGSGISGSALGIIDVGGVPHVLVNGLQVYKLVTGSWSQVGSGTINSGTVTGAAGITVLGSAPYVVWRERTQTRNNQIHVAHWDGKTWAADGSVLNVDSSAEAGSPAITNDGTSVWIAWPESLPASPSQLYVKSLTSGTWSSASASLNVSSSGAALRPQLSYTTQVQLIWDEKDFNTDTRQVYVKGNGDTGASNTDKLTRYGSDGATLASLTILDNTWTYLSPGGIAAGVGVGDEGFDTFAYDPVTKKAYVFGKYHGFHVTSGENQNALLAYNPSKNRWDVTEVAERAADENFPGNGHDEGRATAGNGVYFTHGNLHAGFQSYLYDVKAGRGKQLYPTGGDAGSQEVTTAYDPDDNLVLTLTSTNGFLYDFTTNAWTTVSIPDTSHGWWYGISYDQRGHVFVVFACRRDYVSPCQTWTLAPLTATWTVKPSTPPPYHNHPVMAYDSKHGIHLMYSGDCDAGGLSTWVYDLAIDLWVQVGDFPSGMSSGPCYQRTTTMNLLTYDADDDLFLAHTGLNLTGTLAFRYSPVSPPPPSISSLKAVNLGVTGEDKVGPGNQTTPNGKPDFHISVAGLRGIPTTVTITNDNNGKWETPFNGQNWIIATQYSGQNGDLWFEQYSSNRFHVKVRYADGTTDEADASNQASNAPQSSVAASSTTPTASATPTSSVLPAAAPLTATPPPPSPLIQGQWFAARFDTNISGAKHMSMQYDTANKKLYLTAGDHGGASIGGGVSGAAQSYRQETYSLDPNVKLSNPNDPVAGLAVEYPYCGPAGSPQPKYPDTVGFAWDSTRNVFWFGGGVWDHSPAVCAGEIADYGSNPPQFIQNGMFQFNPTTQLWTVDGNDPPFNGAGGLWGAFFDTVTDRYYQFTGDGNSEFAAWYSPSTHTWSRGNYWPGGVLAGKGYVAWDSANRIAYFIAAANGVFNLWSYRPDTDTATFLSTAPAAGGGSNTPPEPKIVWDSVNQLLFYLRYVFTTSPVEMFVWNPKTPTVWTQLAGQPYNIPSASQVWAAIDVVAFDPDLSAIVAYGFASQDCDSGCATAHNSSGYLFFYRTGDVASLTANAGSSVSGSSANPAASATPTPSVPPATNTTVGPFPSTLKAVYLGVTGEDKVGQLNQTTPNGKPDFHISVSGLRGTPTVLTITNDNNGKWETPFNGTNWIIATQYDGKGNGDFWFEQYLSNKFHVKVGYADGTTDEADASTQASTPQPTPPPSPPPSSALTVAVAPAPASTSGIALSPPTDMIPPSVSFTYPSNGATVSGTNSISVSSSDNVGIAKVELYKDGGLIGTSTNSPYAFQWDTTKDSNGTHTLIAMAYDTSNNRSSVIVSVNVENMTPSTTGATLTIPPVAGANPSTVGNNAATTLTNSIVTAPSNPSDREVTVVIQDGLNGYNGTQDTHLSSYQHSLNFGSTDTLTFGEGGNYGVLVRYAIFQSEGGPIPNGATIKSAVLSLYKYSAYDHTFQAHRLLKDWRETEASWDNANATTRWSISGALGSDTDIVSTADGQGAVGWDPGWLAIDITSGLQAMSNGAPNFGWNLVGVSGNSNPIQFFSRECAADLSLRPKLTISYTLPVTIVAKSSTLQTNFMLVSVAGPPSTLTRSSATTSDHEATVVLQDGLNGYGRTRDAHLYSYNHWLNFGSADALTFGEWGNYNVLVRYAIFQSDGGPIPNGATIKSAVLSLYKYSLYDHTFQAHRLLKDWREMEASWDNASTTTRWSIGGASGSDTDLVSTADGQGAVGWDPGWLAIDITSGLQALSNGAPNYGWNIVGVSGDNNIIRFFSREYATDPSLRPKLTIVYYADTVATAALGQ